MLMKTDVKRGNIVRVVDTSMLGLYNKVGSIVDIEQKSGFRSYKYYNIWVQFGDGTKQVFFAWQLNLNEPEMQND